MLGDQKLPPKLNLVEGLSLLQLSLCDHDGSFHHFAALDETLFWYFSGQVWCFSENASRKSPAQNPNSDPLRKVQSPDPGFLCRLEIG
jgi:hypothetical protein